LNSFLIVALSRLYRLEKLNILAFIVFSVFEAIEPNSTTLWGLSVSDFK